jgi:hypothetical protein
VSFDSSGRDFSRCQGLIGWCCYLFGLRKAGRVCVALDTRLLAKIARCKPRPRLAMHVRRCFPRRSPRFRGCNRCDRSLEDPLVTVAAIVARANFLTGPLE